MSHTDFDAGALVSDPTFPRSDRVWVEAGTSLAVQECGAGSVTVFLVHGLGDASYVWLDIVSALCQCARVVLVDLRGHGESDWSHDCKYDLELFVRDLSEVVHQKSVGPYLVVGHSLGGSIALRYSPQDRENFRGAIAIEPALCASREVGMLIRDRLNECLQGFATRDEFQAYLLDCRPNLSVEWRDRLVEHALLSGLDGKLHYRFDPAVLELETRYSVAGEPSLPNWLGKIFTPVLLLRGEASSVLRPGDAMSIANLIPHCAFATIKGAGHSAMMENPAGVLEQILPFLKDVACSQKRRNAH